MKVQLDSLKLVGIQEVGPSSFNAEADSGAKFGDQLWQKFIQLVVSADLNPQRKMYGVSWPADNLTPPQLINYFVGFQDIGENYSDKFSNLILTGGNYFEFTYKGSPRDIDNGFIVAYTSALPKSGLKSREGQHLEIYSEDFDPTASEIQFKILIPVN